MKTLWNLPEGKYKEYAFFFLQIIAGIAAVTGIVFLIAAISRRI